MSSLMQIGGLISGLDTNSIMDQLKSIAQTPVLRLQQKKAALQAKSAAWAAVNTRLLAIKEKADALADLGKKAAMVASSSASGVNLTASTTAIAGDYTFQVQSLSTYHQVTSQSFADQDTTSVGAGTVTITVDGEETSIDVDNLTLAGLRDAINLQTDSHVKAMIVSDGAATPGYRLVLISQESGTAGAINFSSTLAGGTAPTMSTLSAAEDTVLQFGSGVNAFTITRSTNVIDDVIPGIKMTLSHNAVGETVTINVSPTNSFVKQAIQDFVSQFNTFLDFVNAQNSFNSETGETGILFGEFRLQQIVNDISSNLDNPVAGLATTLNLASQLGIKRGNDGKLTIDDATLDNALKTNMPGVLRLFSAGGDATNSAVSYVTSSKDTKSSGTAGYAIDVTQPAVQAQLALGAALPAALGQDERLTLSATVIDLTAGMTPAEVLAAINAKSSTTGVTASFTGGGDYLTLTRNEYGAAYHVQILSSIDAATPGSTGIGTSMLAETAPGTGNTGVVGMDIAGTINGQSATGLGQSLTSTLGNSKGLQVKVTGTSAGSYGTLTYTRGIGSRIQDLLGFLTDPTGEGGITSTQDTLQASIDQLDEDITAKNDAVTREMERVRKQFDAMEAAMSKLKNQSDQLASQLAQLSTPSTY
ncbi:MAG: flagellar filament capping protein FliD [Armatimonadota bacterium]